MSHLRSVIAIARETSMQKREWARARATENNTRTIVLRYKRKTRGFQIARHFLFRSCSVFIYGSAHMRHATLRRQRESNLDFRTFFFFWFGIGAVSTKKKRKLIFLCLKLNWLTHTRNFIGNRLILWKRLNFINGKEKGFDRFRISTFFSNFSLQNWMWNGDEERGMEKCNGYITVSSRHYQFFVCNV